MRTATPGGRGAAPRGPSDTCGRGRGAPETEPAPGARPTARARAAGSGAAPRAPRLQERPTDLRRTYSVLRARYTTRFTSEETTIGGLPYGQINICTIKIPLTL
ncbi:unnamed protein product [Danaus chrysippus]|uniref:(African queen) hypothetical protein n=1 Tax=Danaus chrysippus TaxID=151541 RepID=A0A8J2RJB0_9NEOP|nr:unnamed protein product [Danaus chrysippus]